MQLTSFVMSRPFGRTGPTIHFCQVALQSRIVEDHIRQKTLQLRVLVLKSLQPPRL